MNPPAEAPSRFDPAQAWTALQSVWRKVGSGAEVLAQGRPDFDGHVLRVQLPAGRLVSRGRRATELRAVLDAVGRLDPPETRLRVDVLPGTGTARDQQAALKQELLDDPKMRRVLDALGAKIERVTPAGEGETR